MQVFCFERQFPWASYEQRMKIIAVACLDAFMYDDSLTLV